MITLKEMLTEDRSNLTARRGCLMALLRPEDCAKIVDFGQRLIRDEDLYLEGEEYGREKDGHVTIRYGFTRDLNELEVRQLLKGIKPFMVELTGLDRFTNPPQYDVAVFKVSSPVLSYLNELSGVYPNVTDFPDYNPHITIAYTKKNTHPNLKKALKLAVPIREICYSPISGGKSYWGLE